MSAEHNATQSIVTSTGSVGVVESRSYDRAYISRETTITSWQEFILAMRQFRLDTRNPELTNPANTRRRQVFRCLVTHELAQLILKSRYGVSTVQTENDTLEFTHHARVEAAVDLQSITGDDAWLISIGWNQHSSLISPAEWQRAESFTKAADASAHIVGALIAGESELPSPLESIQTLPAGYQLARTLSSADEDALFGLWSDRFGWSREQVRTFIEQLPTTSSWIFSGIRENGQLVAATMVEVVKFASFWFAESTEWASDVNGMGAVAIIGSIAQVLERFGADTLVLAETNLTYPSDSSLGVQRTALRAGLRPPTSHRASLSTAHNVLSHNVQVGVGRGHEQGGYESLNNFVIAILDAVGRGLYQPALPEILRSYRD